MNRGFALAIGAYVVIQMLYTLWLKRVAMVEEYVISFGFVLRAAGRTLAVNVEISQWLLICTFLMALFLALCKRRHEKRMTEGSKTAITRPSLLDSDERLIDQLIAVIAGSTIIAYAIYTQWPDTIAKFETNLLSLTIPFVVFGIFRYMHLVYRKNRGDQPEQILLTDTPLMADIALFALSVWWVAIAL